MTRGAVALALMAAVAWATPSQAQTLGANGRPVGTEHRLTLGVSLPIGGANEEDSRPQLELRSTTDRYDWITIGAGTTRIRETRIGLTLERQPQFTLGGRELPAGRDKLGLSTLGYVAIGVGVAAVVGGAILIDRINAASD